MLIITVLLYPHLLLLVSRRFFNHSSGARYSMLVDAVLVSLLIVFMDFNLLASLTFFVCLIISTLLICPPVLLLLNTSIVVSVGAIFFSPENVMEPSWVQDVMSACLLVSFSGFVAFLCFRYRSLLVEDHQRAGKRNEVLQSRLKPYISQQVFHSITENQMIPSRRCHLTVFFSDIEGFTHSMDHLNENAVTRLLNEYLNEMARLAHRFGGTVDKFIGDGVMILYGHSPDIRRDAIACVRMALAMREKLSEIMFDWQQLGQDLHIRIGIDSGFCTVGNLGSSERMEFTAIGSTVNRASRLEGCAGTDEILIYDATYNLVCNHIKCGERTLVTVKGIDKPIGVHCVEGLLEAPDTVRLLR
ncbi:MAG TPA: hypothetical protein DCM54_14885 [Gammaproteobacteria bacterium]|nr:hypothetical protein [Gammaproteobacteria bacterium]